MSGCVGFISRGLVTRSGVSSGEAKIVVSLVSGEKGSVGGTEWSAYGCRQRDGDDDDDGSGRRELCRKGCG